MLNASAWANRTTDHTARPVVPQSGIPVDKPTTRQHAHRVNSRRVRPKVQDPRRYQRPRLLGGSPRRTSTLHIFMPAVGVRSHS